MPLAPVFTLQLNHKILPGMVTVGRYDGTHPCLTCATNAGKVFIHNPHARGARGGRLMEVSGDISLLNINQSVSCIAAGKLDAASDRDVLMVGTQTNLLAYDVQDNADLFYKETPDGANACIVGRLGGFSQPLALIGGNCSLLGFDKTGNDIFWSVTGDNVCSLALVDFSNSGSNELVVGSEDFDLRVFHEDEIVQEMTETEAVTNLCNLDGCHFGYGLANGTVGVYDRSNRFWRIKSKNHPVSIYGYDLDSDGVKELITGWSNGKLDARTERQGEVIFKDTFHSAIAGVVSSDYRLEDKEILMACSNEGEVKGWERVPQHLKSLLLATVTESDSTHELMQLKQNLLLELKNYEENSKVAAGKPSEANLAEMGVIPANTQLQTALSVKHEDKGKSYVELFVGTTNETLVRAVMIFAEGIFEGESYVIHPPLNSLSPTLKVPIAPPKDLPVDLHVKALVGTRNAAQFHVFELTRQMPRFAMFFLVPKLPPELVPAGRVQFSVVERPQRIAMWINTNFLLDEDLVCEGKSELEVNFIALRTKKGLQFSLDTNGKFTILTDDMDLAGELVQALALFLNVEDLNCLAEFPPLLTELQELLGKVNDYQAVRQRLVAEMADHSNLIKSLVVRAEDARLMNDMRNMKKAYMELYDLNRDLINGYKVRSTNHEELLACLKQVNQIIQKAGKLRIGRFKTQVITSCRQAIKNNNINALYKIISTGCE